MESIKPKLSNHGRLLRPLSSFVTRANPFALEYDLIHLSCYASLSHSMTASESASSMTKPGPASDSASERLQNHPAYFWEFVRFKVESFCFQLPKARFLSDSDVFAAEHGMLMSCDEENGGIDSIIPLEASLVEFESFLKAFLPGCPSHHHSRVELSLEEWLSVLKLSSKWLFNGLRNEAIAKLGELPVSPIQRVLLARRYSVPSWLMEGYTKILAEMGPKLDDPKFISLEDAHHLGWEVALELSNITLRRFHGALKKMKPVKADIRSSPRLSKELEEIAVAAIRYGTIDDQLPAVCGDIKVDDEVFGHCDYVNIDETQAQEEDAV
ncbi:hypothetical protein BKA70DRAFT_1150752, partial [Coprinopsis sp. MPI-PUGE-AT-0042]